MKLHFIKDFIINASILSDVYAPTKLKFVLSGTDTLGFYFAEINGPYDRAVIIQTTFIPFKEYTRLLEISDIDEYIKYGGTLKARVLDFKSKEINGINYENVENYLIKLQ